MMTDSVELITGVSITIVTPALVEVAKQLGMPSRWAGFAAMVIAIVLLALSDLASGGSPGQTSFSRWIIAGVVYGLAAAGLYSQTKLPRPASG